MKKHQNFTQEFTHVVKTKQSIKDRKKTLKKLWITCIFIFFAMLIVFSLVFGIDVAKKN